MVTSIESPLACTNSQFEPAIKKLQFSLNIVRSNESVAKE
jgi:hypothetical protein